MRAPDYFKRELQAIDKDYFAWWNGRNHIWEIRWWRKPHRKNDERYSAVVYDRSIVVGRAAQLDNRILVDLRRRKYLSQRRAKDILNEIDTFNEEKRQRAEAEQEDIIRQAVKTAWNASHRIWSKP